MTDPTCSSPPLTPAVRAGGLALVAGALAFVAVFAVLAARMDYPGVLDRPAAEVLPLLAAGGPSLRAVWILYALLPLCFIPAAHAAEVALAGRGVAALRLSVPLASLAAVAMSLGLGRWATVNHALAGLVAGDPSALPTATAISDGLNLYLGTFVGEGLGELFANGWFLVCSLAFLRGDRAERWVGRLGVATAALGTVGALRAATPWVQPVADLNNALLPVWLVTFGLALARPWRVRAGRAATGALAAAVVALAAAPAPARAAGEPAVGEARRLALNFFRSPSIGLEAGLGRFALHAGGYPTLVEDGAEGFGDTTWFARAGLRVDLLRFGFGAAGGSALFADLSYVRGLSSGWESGLIAEAGARVRVWRGLEARLGAAWLVSEGRRPRLNPTPGISWVVPLR